MGWIIVSNLKSFKYKNLLKNNRYDSLFLAVNRQQVTVNTDIEIEKGECKRIISEVIKRLECLFATWCSFIQKLKYFRGKQK